MKNGPLPAVLEHLRQWASRDASVLTDTELLTRFSAGREEAAFAALMRRHGRMVWGVCRQVLGHEQDAEDAFQATFLVLARKAGSIRKGTALASWLHATAYHIATRARRNAAIRRARESKGESMPPAEPISESAWREVLAILDEEVQRLSERQRATFVLCSLEGKSLAEAARQLGWKEGTLSGTLTRAREQLRRRLARRGVTLTAILAGLAVSGESAPAALIEKTFRAALAFASGQSIMGAVSPPIASLVREATRSLVVTKLHVLAAILTAAVAVGGVAGFVGQKPEPKQEAGAEPAARSAEQPKPRRDEDKQRPRVDRFGDPLPPGALARIGTVRFRDGGWIFHLAYSPDGKILAAGYEDGTVRFWEAATGKIRREWATQTGTILSLAFSSDGKLLASAGSDTTVLIWPTDGETKPRDLSIKDLQTLWSDLASDDAVKAYQSISVLRAASRQTVPFLKAHLRPVAEVDAKHLARLIADLDDERFSVREKASAELVKYGDRAEAILCKTLEEKPSLEMRRRIQAILEELNHPLSAEQLRDVRTIEVLEQIGTLSAQEVLKALAKGAPGARLTREAKASLQRLSSRTVREP